MNLIMGLSSLDNYSFVQSYFSRLFQSIEQKNYSPGRMIFKLNTNSLQHSPLMQLYNFCCEALIQDTGIEIAQSTSPLKAAWVSKSFIQQQSYSQLSRSLTQSSQSNIYQQVFYLPQPHLTAQQVNTDYSNCKDLNLLSIANPIPGQDFKFQVQPLEQDCPVTIALNYSENYVVTANDKKLASFIANGALLGFVLPKSTREFQVTYKLPSPMWVQFGFYTGLISLLLGFFSLGRKLWT